MIIFSLSGLIFFGCTEKSSPPLTTQQTSETVEIVTSQTQVLSTPELAEMEKVIEEKLPLWVNMWRSSVPNFSISAFKKIEEKKIMVEVESLLDSEDDKLDEMLRVYSPDKTKYVDPHLDIGIFEEDGKIQAGLDVDSGVALADLTNKTWKRLMFCGTPCHFDDAVWINDDVFVVVGESEYYEGNSCMDGNPCPHVATLDVFDLSNNTVTHYYGPPIEKDMSGYLHLRFPQLRFDFD